MSVHDFFANKVSLYNLLSGEHILIAQTPFKLGSDTDCDLQLHGEGVAAAHCVFQRKGRKTYLVPADSGIELNFDGHSFSGGEIIGGRDHVLAVGPHFFAVRGDQNPTKWAATLNRDAWFAAENGTVALGPFTLPELRRRLRSMRDLSKIVVTCQGLDMGFYAEQILPAIEVTLARQTSSESISSPPVSAAQPEVSTDYGEFTCPVCWLKFDRGDVMNIAVHADLQGDPLLGEDRMQRFNATRFNDRGQALDPMGMPAPEIACPHCRRRLPGSFLDLPNHIFSIVGAPTSGKSYYLAALAKKLQTTLFSHFNVSFRDADPIGNALLNQMKEQLFSSSTPQEAQLAKTGLEGATYERLPRMGRTVMLPKPFIFQLSGRNEIRKDFSLVFYDNAGEHFQPGGEGFDSTGAQHIAAASAIFFLFDPLFNAEFRHLLSDQKDPQLSKRHSDQQDVILAESEVRVKAVLGLDARQRIRTPFAVIVGKSDAWIHLIGEEKIGDPIRNGVIDLSIVEANSRLIRSLLLNVHPAIVANAESISSDVVYLRHEPAWMRPS